MDREEKSQKAWISHFVGNWLVKARFETSQGRSAEEVKSELISKLDLKAEGMLVEEVKGLLRAYDWSTRENVELFFQDYVEFDKRYF